MLLLLFHATTTATTAVRGFCLTGLFSVVVTEVLKDCWLVYLVIAEVGLFVDQTAFQLVD